ncbi:MAG: futalosine hydrolase [Nitrospirae bacterium]|nr:futalosine hydrolase [Nitrospirota bacterium]
MAIGIVISTELEAGIILEQLAGRKLSSIQHKAFHSGALGGGPQAAVCICGVGKTNAAHGTTLLLERFRPGLVYSLGVAGAYPSSGLDIGDIAVAEKEIYGDEGLAPGGEFHTMDAIRLPLFSGGGIAYYNEFPLLVPEKIKNFKARGNFITVSACSGTLERGREIERRFRALCENMEGAAIAHICTLNGTPVVEIRGISNVIADRTAAPLNRQHIITAAGNVQRFFLEEVLDE